MALPQVCASEAGCTVGTCEMACIMVRLECFSVSGLSSSSHANFFQSAAFSGTRGHCSEKTHAVFADFAAGHAVAVSTEELIFVDTAKWTAEAAASQVWLGQKLLLLGSLCGA
eukprot:1122759-Amphidinium_carterae.1